MGVIFISYRRDDSRGDTGRLYDRLGEHFGEKHLFRDVDVIAPGDRFAEVLDERLATCDVLLAVIGPHWLSARDGGRRRLDDPNDYVRREIAAALQRNVPVIPVLVGDARMPRPRDLPSILEPLASRQAAPLREDRFRADVDTLIEQIVAVASAGKTARARRTVDPSRPWALRDSDWFYRGEESICPPLIIEWPARALSRGVTENNRGLSREITQFIDEMLQRLWHDKGVLVPGICMKEASGEGWEYTVRLFGVPMFRDDLYISYRFFRGDKQQLEAARVDGIAGTDPITRRRGYWITAADSVRVRANRELLWETLEFPIRVLEAQIRANLPQLIGHQECMDLIAASVPSGEKEIAASKRALSDLVLVCRALLAENATLSPFKTILDMFLRLRAARHPLVEIVEEIRSAEPMRRALPGNADEAGLLALSPAFEDTIRRSLDHSGSQTVLSMQPEATQHALQAVRDSVGAVDGPAVLLVKTAAIRPFVRKLIGLEFPHVYVISQRELLTKAAARVRRTIDL